jgi:hypothetical protein
LLQARGAVERVIASDECGCVLASSLLFTLLMLYFFFMLLLLQACIYLGQKLGDGDGEGCALLHLVISNHW